MGIEQDEQAGTTAANPIGVLPHAEIDTDATPWDENEQPLGSASEHFADLDALIRSARSAADTGQRDAAADFWRRVLALDATNLEALAFLQSRSKDLSEQNIRRRITELRRKASSELISELNEALRIAREISTSSILDDESSRLVADLEHQVLRKRSIIQSASSEIQTLAAANMLKEVITRLEGQISMGRFEFIDRDGTIVPTSDMLREYNNEYASFCTQKALEYIERAELSLPYYPRTAKDVLVRAWEAFDRADPAVRDLLERRIMEVGEQIESWEKAQALVRTGIEDTDPTRRLRSFMQARAVYPGLEGMDSLIGEAERDVCAVVVFELREALVKGRHLLATGQFEAALEIAHVGRRKAMNAPRSCSSLLSDIDASVNEIDELLSSISNAFSSWRARQIELTRRLDEVDFIIAQRDYEKAEIVLTGVLAETNLEADLRLRAQKMQFRIAAFRKTESVLANVRAAIANDELDQAEILLAAMPRDVAAENAQIVALQQQLMQAKEQRLRRQRENETEAQICSLFETAGSLFHQRLFVTSGETLDRVPAIINRLPQERRAQWEVRVFALRAEITEATTVWSDYAQARTHIWEAQGTHQAEYMKEATQLLSRVIQFPSVGAVVSAIQQEARELYDGIMLGISLMQGNLEEVEKRLIMMLAMNPHDVNAVLSLHRVQATKYLRSFAEQADETRRMARREARSWYIASLVSGVIFAGLFIFAVLYVLLARPDDTLSYLAPLYTFVPGILSALFLKQYNDANQRLDAEQKLLWEQVKDFERKQLDELLAARPQPSTGQPPSESSAATPSEPGSIHTHIG